MKQIQFTKGCPNNCEYCYEPKEMEYLDPEIPDGEELLQILDMNILSNPKAEKIIVDLMEINNKNYELICGIDFRRLDQGMCNLLHNARFVKMRWAWDYGLGQQKIQKKTYNMFVKAGYKKESLMVFILVNWKITYKECLKKLKLLLRWNVMVSDCCFDGGYPKSEKEFNDPYGRFEGKRYWKYKEIIEFRKECRDHSHMIWFGIYPELKYNDIQPLDVVVKVKQETLKQND